MLATSLSNDLTLLQLKTTSKPSAVLTVTWSTQYGSGLKVWISSCLWTQKPKVGVWHGPYEINEASKSPYFPWKNLVWNLVNAQPIRKSNSWRASTLLASFSFGLARLANAALISLSVMAENFALHISCKWFYFNKSTRHLSWFYYMLLTFGFSLLVDPSWTACITSKQIFSPSLSQSSHRTK